MSNPHVFDHLFLSIGAMKAGTTWLYDVLHRHPEIHFSNEKEIHYFFSKYVRPGVLSERSRLRRAKGYLAFDPEVSRAPVLRRRIDWTSRWLSSPVDDKWFNGLFRAKGDATWIADFSNLNALVTEDGWREIHATSRELRVLYTLREPLSRTWSHVRFHLKMQGKGELLDEWSDEELFAHIQEGDYLEHTDYVSAVTRLQNALPERSVKIAFYDDISGEPTRLVREIEDFLGIPNQDVPSGILERVVNPSPKRDMPDAVKEMMQPFVAAQVSGLRELGIEPPANWG